MKTEISSIELAHLINELQKIKGSRIEKVYSSTNKDVYFQLYKAELGKPLLRVNVPGVMYLSTHKPEFSHPSNFCMALRKRLTNGIITGITKLGNERIVKITIDKMDDKIIKKKHLYFEFFLKGNVILTDDRDDIQILSEGQSWVKREVRIKKKYVVPHKTVHELTTSLNVELVKFLADKMNLGGEYAEEVCFRASIEKTRKELSEDEIKHLNDVIQTVSNPPAGTGYVYVFDGKKYIFPIRMETMKGYDKIESFPSFNDAISSVFTESLKSERVLHKKKEQRKSLSKYEKIIDMQKKQLEKNKKVIDESTKKGELIYQNFTYISELLSQLKEAREIMSWSEIKKKLKNHKVIKSIDEKKGKMTLSFE